MSSVEDHYQHLLAAHYTWMSGGLDAKIQDNRRLFESLALPVHAGAKALDLGCGSGFQTLALAELGYSVTAIDTSHQLIDELQRFARERSIHGITPLVADMRDESAYAQREPFDIAVCMGDTLVHLPSYDDVATCLASMHRHLKVDGTIVLSFRDLTTELTGIDRAIPVRLDDNRLMATFLEYEPEHVVVNDMIFTRDNGPWTMHKSSYRKLRLPVAKVATLLKTIGFKSVDQSTERGFTTIVARNS